jgi:hypothetical protein
LKNCNGLIDSLELAILNGKGIDHKQDLLQDLKQIRVELEHYQLISENPATYKEMIESYEGKQDKMQNQIELLTEQLNVSRHLEKEVERLTRVIKLLQKENEKYRNFANALKEILPED